MKIQGIALAALIAVSVVGCDNSTKTANESAGA
ncbi:MAG: hypothetical protein JWM04_2156, partial [Verrucomicrobiales bacterium]|nr:hypothetical protein [Verrucomicrobiales bacterium]